MMFKQLDRLQRYTFLHELQRVPYTFLHELSVQTYTFLHELLLYYVHDNRFPILFIIIESLHILPQFLVERMLRHRVFIAEDDELHAGSRHRHVHATEVFQETNLSFIIRTYQGDENYIALLTLETIHRVYADEATVRLEELILFDELLQILHLGTIRRNDAHVDAIAQHPLLAYLGEVFRQGEQGKLGFRLVDAAVTFTHELLLVK